MTNPTIICLVIVGIAITYAIIFALARRETRHHHTQALDMHASNVGLVRMRNETNEALALRIRDAMRYQHQSGNRHTQTMSMVDVENAASRDMTDADIDRMVPTPLRKNVPPEWQGAFARARARKGQARK